MSGRLSSRRDLASHHAWHSDHDKKDLYKSYRSQLGQTQLPDEDRLLYTAKCLDLQWNAPDAQEFARLTYAYLENNDTLSAADRLSTAYQGFSKLRIHFDEPNYDYHKKLGVAFEAILLLSSMRDNIDSFKTKADLPFQDFPIKYFDEHDIPRARVCELLMVAYGLYPAFSGDKTFDYQGRISFYGREAFDLYQQALQGATTQEQRTHYHNRILLLSNELIKRVPEKTLDHINDSQPIIKKSATYLAREQKDALEEIDPAQNPLSWCHMKKKLAFSLHYSDKTDKALKHLQDVIDFQLHEDFHKTEDELLLKKLKVNAEGLMIAFSDPSKLFDHQIKNLSLYWGQ